MPNLAAIDVGSNAIRLTIASSSAGTAKPRPAYSHRYPLRLGQDAFAAGELSSATLDALVAVFSEIAATFADYEVAAYRAVATSALRAVQDSEQVVARIQAASGLGLEVISGAEEAELARRALLASVPECGPDTVLLDLGGGSLELGRVGEPGAFASYPLGTIRWVSDHPELARAVAADKLATFRMLVAKALTEHLGEGPKAAPVVVGTGGNLNVLARLLPRSDGSSGIPEIAVADLANFASDLAPVPPAERVKRYTIRPDRADIILPATLIISELCTLLQCKRFFVPGTGIRDAILADLAQNL